MSTENEQTPNTAVATTKNEIATVTKSPSERFTDKVMSLFPNGGTQKIQLTTLQKKLINNYFIKLDGVLKDGEIKRLAKSEQYRDPLEYSWSNVNMNKLAQDVIAFSEIGLDPLQPNHINPIPYKNSKTNKLDITFIPGYDGIEIKAIRYGLNPPDTAIIELVYSTDKFKQIKKDLNNPIETYIFEVIDEFDRGELKGGFYYHIYNDDPSKNKLVVMNKNEIEKRKPTYASAEFWGGEKDKYVDGKKKGKETIDGWYDRMCWKTIKRACWNEVNIDPEKIDDHLQRMLVNDQEAVSNRVRLDIEQNANQETIDIDSEEVVDDIVVNEPKTVTATPKEAFDAPDPISKEAPQQTKAF